MVDKERDDDSGKVPQPTPGAKGTATVYAPPTVPHADSTPTPTPAPTPGKKGVATVYAAPTSPQQSNPVSGSTGSQNPNDTSYQARQQQAQDQANTYYKERGLNPTQDQLNQKVSDYARSLEINGKLTPGTPEYDQALGNYLKANNLQLVPSTPNPKETSPPDYGKDNYGYTKDVKVSDVVKKGFTQNTSDIMSSDLGETIQNKPPSKAQQDLITAQAMKETFSGLSTGQPAQRKGIDVKLTQGTRESQAQLDQAASNAYDKASRLYGNNYFGSDDRTAIGSLAGKKVISNPNGAGLLIVPEKTLPENHIPLGNELIQPQQVKPQAKSPTAYTVGLYENVGVSEGLGAGTSNVQSFVNDLVKQAKGDAAKTIDVLEITNYNAEGVQIQKTHTLESVPIEKAQEELPNLVRKYSNNPNVVYSHQNLSAHPMIGSTLETEQPNEFERVYGTQVSAIADPIADLMASTYALTSSMNKERVQTLINDVHNVISGKQTLTQFVQSEYKAGIYSSESQKFVNENTMPLEQEPFSKGVTSLIAGKGFDYSTSRGPAYDIPALATNIGLMAMPIGPGKISRLSPIKTESFKAVTEEGKVITVARTVNVGYGSKVVEVGTVTNGKLYAGSAVKNVEKTRLADIEAVGIETGMGPAGGYELTTQGRLGTKILTSPQGMKVLEEAGKALPRDVEAVQLQKELGGIIKFSEKNIPNKLRQKAEALPETPLTTLQPGSESKALNEQIIPKSETMKGTLAETVQLEKDLIIKKGTELNTPEKVAGNIRNRTTGDVDIDYAHLSNDLVKAKAFGQKAVDIFNSVAGQGRKFEQRGTNVKVKTLEGKEETVLNILTQKDVKTGYLNTNDLKPFGITLSGKILKVPTHIGSKNYGKFVTIEQQALNRIESSVSLQGPKTPKFVGEEPIPYLKEGAAIQRTPKGYTVLPVEHRLKDLSKLISQDVEQISRNLEKAGYIKEATRAREIKNRIPELYPEIDFNLKTEPLTSESSQKITSKLSATISGAKQTAKPLSSVAGLGLVKAESLTKETSKTKSEKQIESPNSVLKSKSKSSLSSSRGRGSLARGSIGRLSKSDQKSLNSSSSSSKLSASSTSSLSPSSAKSPSSPKSPASPTSPSSPKSFGSPSSPAKFGPSPTTTITQPTKIFPVADIKNKTDQGIKLKPKPRADFLGNSSEIQVVGLYNRIETVYGLKKIGKLSRQDYSKMTKGFPKLVTSKSNSLTPKRNASILTQNKKQKGKIKF